jgi:hypothetical protein
VTIYLSDEDVRSLTRILDFQWTRLDERRRRLTHDSPLYRKMLAEQQAIERIQEELK